MDKKDLKIKKLLEENIRLKKELEAAMLKSSADNSIEDNKLKISQTFFKGVFDSIQNGILVLSKDFKVIMTNKWMTENFGNIAPVHGYKCYQTIMSNEAICDNCPAQRTINTMLPSTQEFNITRNGKNIWIEVTAFPIKNEKGELTNVIEYVKNITPAKVTKEILIEKEKFISAIANTTPAMIQVFDMTNMKHIYINDAAQSLLGYSNKEIRSMDAFAEDGILHPEDRLMVLDLLNQISLYKHNQVAEVIFRLKHKDGDYRTFRNYIRPFQRNNNREITRLIGISIDISEQQLIHENLKETSYKLSNIALAANDGMWDWYLETGKVIFDERYYTMAGYKVNEFPHTFMEFKKRIHPEDTELVLKMAREHLQGKTDRFVAEFRFLRKDQSWMWILARGKIAERNNDGDPVRLLGTHTDITELKSIQNDFREAKNKAEESDRLKSAFLANMSHEIRTPMNGILGFAELLSDELLTKDEISEYVEIIKKSGQRMLMTINDIIDISKIESGLIEVVAGELDINKQLEYLHSFFLPEAKKKGLLLTLQIRPLEGFEKINTDHSKFIAIMTNLIKNAIKFTQTGSITIGYSLMKNDIKFYVEDTGIGIPNERIEAIFDRFVQADLTSTKSYEGSGLGLSISKGYVELLGGRIWVESDLNKGSTFFFTLPIKKKEAQAETQTEDISNLHLRILSDKTVLIVEDEENVLAYLNELFKTTFKEIFIARTGVEAVDICKNNPSIDLILMDIKLPKMDGYEATRRIRSFNEDVIIIGQTAFALQGDKEKVLASGCNDYIAKPIDRNSLFKTVYKHLR
ncbi:PAS domain-containing protein [Bacteroidota bacterium]